MYLPSDSRYTTMTYNRCGKSGLLLPAISLGLWHNFGAVDDFKTMTAIIHHAFDKGITHFDLANNYGPPAGDAEINFGKILDAGLRTYRDELIISSKAGYYMWPGPYGEWGSRKYLIASIDQSLKRMGLDYVDIFYSHRPDPNTPLEETMMALDSMVKSGKALYVGISSYSAHDTQKAIAILKQLGTPCLIHQPKYSMFVRWVEEPTTASNLSLLDVLGDEGVGCIAFSPLAQGLLTNKYLHGVPSDSRIGRGRSNGAITTDSISPDVLEKINKLNEIALHRNQSLAQMAIAWLLKNKTVTSILIGASSTAQLDDNLSSLKNLTFSNEELTAIEAILASQ